MTAHVVPPEVRADARPLKPRQERREAALRGWFVRDSDQSTWDFAIVNLSYGGCRLKSSANLKRGESLRLAVPNRGKIAAVVQWRRGEDAGLSFVVEGDSKERPRQAERNKARLEVLVRRPGRRSQWIDGRDISPLGCCLEFVDVPRPDDLLWIQLPGLEAIEGRVRWTDQHRAGVLFEKPIHPAVFELLLERWTA